MMSLPRTSLAATDCPFPNAAVININHLGLSAQTRFNAKQKLVRDLTTRNDLIGVEELHVSSARAQDVFFDHFHNFTTFYNINAMSPGQCIMVRNTFLEQNGMNNDSARD